MITVSVVMYVKKEIPICCGSNNSSKFMFSRFTEVLTVAMATSELRAFAEGNHSTLASLQP